MKKFFKRLLVLIIIILLIALAYLGYMWFSYHRIGSKNIDVVGSSAEVMRPGAEYSILSWNIGFGAYTADYDFFMDGGTQSWATSEEDLRNNMMNISKFIFDNKKDLVLVQEVDIDSTRSYHVNERDYLISGLMDHDYDFAQNYDSSFLFYPITQPHGISRSGIMAFSKFDIRAAERVELPVETGLTKFLDLDRCYTKSMIKIDGGKELALYNFHLSAYTSDGAITTQQLEMLAADMESEYKKGNYCIAGGDFNKDVLGNSAAYFGVPSDAYTWCQPVPEDLLEAHSIKLIAPFSFEKPVASVRNPDSAYHEGQFICTIDGFMVTDNVEVLGSSVCDTGFAWSDHNPVTMSFTLK